MDGSFGASSITVKSEYVSFALYLFICLVNIQIHSKPISHVSNMQELALRFANIFWC